MSEPDPFWNEMYRKLDREMWITFGIVAVAGLIALWGIR